MTSIPIFGAVATRPPSCSKDDDPSEHDRPRGQALVEFAILLPVLMFTCIGFIEAGLLVAAKTAQDRNVAVLADYAAQRPADDSWHSLIHDLGLADCDVQVEADAGKSLIHASATCPYRPVVGRVFDHVDISSTAIAVIHDVEPEPTAAPTVEPSGSVAP